MPNLPAIPQADIDRALAAARAARSNAHAPYSNFKVGAALLTVDGQLVTGCNVEVASWEEGTCAERNAIGNAITQGLANHNLSFIRLVVVSTQSAGTGAPLEQLSPCGACRQVISDFCEAENCSILLDDGNRQHSFTLAQLFLHGFKLPATARGTQAISCEQVERTATANLLAAAQAIRDNADVHMEKKPEGAAILSADGRVFCGASVENACTPLMLHALRVANGRAVAAGAAQAGQRHITQAALALPARGKTAAEAMRLAINPALVNEFFADDAEITLAIDGQQPRTLKAAELFAWADKAKA